MSVAAIGNGAQMEDTIAGWSRDGVRPGEAHPHFLVRVGEEVKPLDPVLGAKLVGFARFPREFVLVGHNGREVVYLRGAKDKYRLVARIPLAKLPRVVDIDRLEEEAAKRSTKQGSAAPPQDETELAQITLIRGEYARIFRARTTAKERELAVRVVSLGLAAIVRRAEEKAVTPEERRSVALVAPVLWALHRARYHLRSTAAAACRTVIEAGVGPTLEVREFVTACRLISRVAPQLVAHTSPKVWRFQCGGLDNPSDDVHLELCKLVGTGAGSLPTHNRPTSPSAPASARRRTQHRRRPGRPLSRRRPSSPPASEPVGSPDMSPPEPPEPPECPESPEPPESPAAEPAHGLGFGEGSTSNPVAIHELRRRKHVARQLAARILAGPPSDRTAETVEHAATPPTGQGSRRLVAPNVEPGIVRADTAPSERELEFLEQARELLEEPVDVGGVEIEARTADDPADPQTGESQPTEPQIAEPQMAEPRTADPEELQTVEEPQTAEPQIADTAGRREPQIAEPKTADPQAAEPRVVGPTPPHARPDPRVRHPGPPPAKPTQPRRSAASASVILACSLATSRPSPEVPPPAPTGRRKSNPGSTRPP